MPTLKIHNPYNGTVIEEIPADDAASVADKAAAARAAQPACRFTPQLPLRLTSTATRRYASSWVSPTLRSRSP